MWSKKALQIFKWCSMKFCYETLTISSLGRFIKKWIFARELLYTEWGFIPVHISETLVSSPSVSQAVKNVLVFMNNCFPTPPDSSLSGVLLPEAQVLPASSEVSSVAAVLLSQISVLNCQNLMDKLQLTKVGPLTSKLTHTFTIPRPNHILWTVVFLKKLLNAHCSNCRLCCWLSCWPFSHGDVIIQVYSLLNCLVLF